MKKTFSILLAFLLTLMFLACGTKQEAVPAATEAPKEESVQAPAADTEKTSAKIDLPGIAGKVLNSEVDMSKRMSPMEDESSDPLFSADGVLASMDVNANAGSTKRVGAVYYGYVDIPNTWNSGLFSEAYCCSNNTSSALINMFYSVIDASGGVQETLEAITGVYWKAFFDVYPTFGDAIAFNYVIDGYPALVSYSYDTDGYLVAVTCLIDGSSTLHLICSDGGGDEASLALDYVLSTYSTRS